MPATQQLTQFSATDSEACKCSMHVSNFYGDLGAMVLSILFWGTAWASALAISNLSFLWTSGCGHSFDSDMSHGSVTGPCCQVITVQTSNSIFVLPPGIPAGSLVRQLCLSLLKPKIFQPQRWHGFSTVFSPRWNTVACRHSTPLGRYFAVYWLFYPRSYSPLHIPYNKNDPQSWSNSLSWRTCRQGSSNISAVLHWPGLNAPGSSQNVFSEKSEGNSSKIP